MCDTCRHPDCSCWSGWLFDFDAFLLAVDGSDSKEEMWKSTVPTHSALPQRLLWDAERDILYNIIITNLSLCSFISRGRFQTTGTVSLSTSDLCPGSAALLTVWTLRQGSDGATCCLSTSRGGCWVHTVSLDHKQQHGALPPPPPWSSLILIWWGGVLQQYCETGCYCLCSSRIEWLWVICESSGTWWDIWMIYFWR